MTEEELSRLLQEHGWYLGWSKVYHKRFAYAKRRVKGQDKVISRYLKSESKLDDLTEAEVLRRISS